MNREQPCRVAALFLLTALSFAPFALSQEKETPRQADDRPVPPDSIIRSVIPIQHVGTLDRRLSPERFVTDTTARWNEYVHLNDIVSARTGTFVRDLGSVGQFSGLTIGGLDGRAIVFMHDGIQLNEPLTGTYNSYWYQTEQIERVEIETGPRAFLYGINSTGGAINVVSKSYKAIRPYTHIRYSESTYEQILFDGMVSQNLTRRLNVTGGVLKFSTDGRFQNSDYDAWGARFKIRLDPTSRLSIFFSENYTQTQLGLFGGIDFTTSPELRFDRLRATIVSGDTYEKITRHDLQLGIAAAVFNDSSSVTTVTAYSSTQLREFRNEDNRPNPDTLFIQDNHKTRWLGVKATQHFELADQTLDLGAEIQSRQVLESPATGYRAHVATSAFGKVELEPIDRVRLAVYGRIDRYLGRTPLSYGADGSITPFEGLKIFAGYSQSVRFPTFQELYWRMRNISGPTTEFEPERHHFLESGIRLRFGHVFSIEGRFFYRSVDNSIEAFHAPPDEPFRGVQFATRERNTYRGVDVASRIRFWSLFLEGSVSYIQVQDSGVAPPAAFHRLPEWTASGGIYFWDKLLDDKLHLKIGVRGRIWSEQQGMEFNPEANLFVPSSLPPLGLSTVMDAVIVAHIGDAYIHLLWQNLFDNDYVITPFYPMPDRAVRFGVSWDLLD